MYETQKVIMLVKGQLADERAGVAANIFNSFEEANRTASELGWNVDIVPLSETEWSEQS